MGKDNQPKARQAAKLARKKAQRAPFERILIVCEGTKTEPHYFREIRTRHRLHTANVQVHPGLFGTQPLQVVEYAEHLFRVGDAEKQIQPRAFEQVYSVFDRDNHDTYHNALGKADSMGQRLRNDLNQPIKFKAIASVPCFELWFLLHFEDVLAPIHRADAYLRLDQHLPGYAKGQQGYFERTRPYLDVALGRAAHLAEIHSPYDGYDPYTDVHLLVTLLTTLNLE